VQARTDGARYENEVVVDPGLCAACGICVGSCPSSNPFRQKNEKLETGIDMPGFPINEIRTDINNALEKLSGDNKILVMGCDNALDFAGLESENLHVLSLYCIGMMPPTVVEYALNKGADGVLITGCRTGDCYYRYGNKWMDQRFDGSRRPILRGRADRDRIKVFRAAETDCKNLRREVSDFQEHIQRLRQKESTDQKESANG